MKGIRGWLLVYVIGSIPMAAFYSMGLSGWFFEYPIPLMVLIFLCLAAPLALILLKSPRAPRWNVTMLWATAILMTLRALNVVLWPLDGEEHPPPRGEELAAVISTLSGIVAIAAGWTVIWTRYFNASARVRNTFKP